MKLVSLALLTLGIMPLAEQAAPRPATPIAYVSLQKILSESAEARNGAKQLESLRQERSQEVTARQKALEATRLELANAGGILRGARRAELQERVRQQESDLQRVSQQGQADLQNLQRRIQADLRGKINGIVADIMKRRAIVFVLNEDSAIIAAPAAADLTREVLDRLNAAGASAAPAK